MEEMKIIKKVKEKILNSTPDVIDDEYKLFDIETIFELIDIAVKEYKVNKNGREDKTMKLCEVIDQLQELDVIRETTEVIVYVTEKHSLDVDDRLFECRIPAGKAKKYFGELYITCTDLKTVGEYNIPTFSFTLHEEADDKDMQN